MSKKLYGVVSLLILASMILAACGGTAPPADGGGEEAAFKACQVTDTGGIDDKSFNETAWNGALMAEDELGVEAQFLESQEQADYEENINAFIEEDCGIIITVGFLLGDATAAAAEANPDRLFSIVDFAYDPPIDNVQAQIFNTDEAAFLAGYLAAGVTETGAVGTFGGLQIPTVTVFMDGFYYGVQYYNEQNGTEVEVLGWDPVAETGLFAGNFESTDDGRRLGESLMDEGADIIMPVAGPVGVGTAAAVQERGGAYIIGVDADWFETQPQYADITLTSVLKNMDVTTFNAIEDAMDGSFDSTTVVGTLENEGVGLAPYHNLADMVPDELDAEISTIREGIIAGDISVGG